MEGWGQIWEKDWAPKLQRSQQKHELCLLWMFRQMFGGLFCMYMWCINWVLYKWMEKWVNLSEKTGQSGNWPREMQSLSRRLATSRPSMRPAGPGEGAWPVVGLVCWPTSPCISPTVHPRTGLPTHQAGRPSTPLRAITGRCEKNYSQYFNYSLIMFMSFP